MSALSVRQLRIDQLFPPAAQTVTVNGTGVDLKGSANAGTHEFRVRINVGAVTGTTPTLVAKIQDSPDNSTFTDVAGATTATLNAAGIVEFYFKTTQRYVRLVLTLGGTSPNYTMDADLVSVLRTV